MVLALWNVGTLWLFTEIMPLFMLNYVLAEILIKLRLLKFLNLILPVTINGVVMKFPVINVLGFQNLKELKQGREPWLDGIISTALQQKSGTFIDVGVNLGQTLLKVKAIDPHREYVGFEPNPSCCFYTSKLITLNQFKHCKLVPVGLHEKAGLLKLLMRYGEDDPCATVAIDQQPDFFTSEKIVVVDNGDHLIKELMIEAISILKIDVEGAELEVVRGLQQSIATFRPFILCEILPIHIDGTAIGSVTEQIKQQRIDALEQIFKQHKYVIGRIHASGAITVVETIREHLDHSHYQTFDYLLIPAESQQSFGH